MIFNWITVLSKLAIIRPRPHFEILEFQCLLYWYQMCPERFGKKSFNGLILPLENQEKPIFWHIWGPVMGHAHILKFSFSQKCKIFLYIFRIYIVIQLIFVILWDISICILIFFILEDFQNFCPWLWMDLKSWWQYFFQLFLTFSVFILC